MFAMFRLMVTLFIAALFAPALSVQAQTEGGSLCDIIKEAPPALPAGATPAQTLENSGLQMAQLGDFNTAVTLFSQAINIDEPGRCLPVPGCAYLRSG
jgi:hypothetical protein